MTMCWGRVRAAEYLPQVNRWSGDQVRSSSLPIYMWVCDPRISISIQCGNTSSIHKYKGSCFPSLGGVVLKLSDKVRIKTHDPHVHHAEAKSAGRVAS
jgi:hypothetical protein